MASGKGTVKIAIIGDSSNLKKSLDEAQSYLAEFGSKSAETFKGFLEATGAVEGIKVVGEQLADMVKEGEAAQQSQASLAQALKATHQNVRDLGGQLDEAQASMLKYGFAAQDTTAAMTALTEHGMDWETAQKSLNVIADLAAARHISLADASTMYAKALSGSGKFLKEYGIDAKSVKDNQDALNKALESKVGGQAAAQAETAAGSMKVMSATIDDAKEKIGEALIPILAKLLTALAPVITSFSQHLPQAIAALTPVFQRISTIVGQVFAVVGPIIQQFVRYIVDHWPQISAVIQTVMDNVQSVISAVVSFIQAIWQHFGTQIIEIMRVAWKYVSDVFNTALNVIQDVIRLFSDLFKGHWGKLWGDVVQLFKDYVGGLGRILWDALTGLVPIAVQLIGKLMGAMGDAVAGLAGSVWDGLKTGLVDVINWVIDRLNDMIGDIPLQGHFGIPSIPKIPHIGGGGASAVTSSGIGSIANSTPSIRKYHSGGIVPGSQGTEVLAILQAGERVIPASGGAQGTVAPIVNIVAQTNASAYDIARAASSALRRGGY